MPEFTVIYETSTSLGLVVEADDVESAVDEADNEGVQGLCHQCSGSWGRKGPGRWWREEGDETAVASILDSNGDTVFEGPVVSEQRAIFELEQMADKLDADGFAEAAARVRVRVESLRSGKAIPVVGQS